MQTRPTDEPTKVNGDKTSDKTKEELQKVHKRMMKRFSSVDESEAHQDNKKKANEDASFATKEGGMWDDGYAEAWGDRPTLEVNQLQSMINTVIGAQRESDIGVKVLPAGAGSTKKIADTFNGIIRNIQNISNFDDPRDNSFRESATAGFGGMYVTTEWNIADPWVQDIKIKPIRSAVNMLWIDQSSTGELNEDANWMMIGEEMSDEDFKEEYPDAHESDFPIGEDDYRSGCSDSWRSEGKVRVGDYWEKVRKIKTIGKFRKTEVDPETGESKSTEATWDIEKKTKKILDEAAGEGWEFLKEREMESFEIVMYKVSGTKVLAGPFPWAGIHIPIVPEYGYDYWINGVRNYWGMVRFSKDSARLYNYTISSILYQMSKSKTKTALTKAMAADTMDEWENPDQDIVTWTPDPNAPGAVPITIPGAQISSAEVIMMQEASQNQQKITGRHASSQGDNPLDQSGKAIQALQSQGALGTFALIDNLAKSIRRIGEILVDLIPRIYDTERQIRIVEADGSTKMIRTVVEGSEDFAKVNTEIEDEETGEKILLVNLNQGRYDVTESVSVAYETRRQEFRDHLTQIAQTSPEVGMLLLDLIVKTMDFDGTDEALERIQEFMVSQGLRQPTAEEIQAAKERAEKIPPQEPSFQEQAAQKDIELTLEAKELANEASASDVKLKTLELEKQIKEIKKLEAATLGEVVDTDKTIAEIDNVNADTDVKESTAEKNRAETRKTIHEIGADRVRLASEITERDEQPETTLQ